jgi:hypothetical protein
MDAFDLNLVDRRSTQHRQRKGVASRVANAVMESRRHDGGHTQVDYASARGSENERPRAGTRSSLRAIAAFLATFLMLMWAIPAPRSSLGAADSANRSTELGKPRMSREVSREDADEEPSVYDVCRFGRDGCRQCHFREQPCVEVDGGR